MPVSINDHSSERINKNETSCFSMVWKRETRRHSSNEVSRHNDRRNNELTVKAIAPSDKYSKCDMQLTAGKPERVDPTCSRILFSKKQERRRFSVKTNVMAIISLNRGYNCTPLHRGKKMFKLGLSTREA